MDPGSAYAATGWSGTLRRQQVEALAALDAAWARGSRRAWVVLPPGTGKTLVGLEAARRLGRTTIVLGPNTAIQGQWVTGWSQFEPATVRAGTDRTLSTPLTVLTYQSLAVFAPDDEVDEEGRLRPSQDGADLLSLLHDNGQALVKAIRAANRTTGPVTLVLDEAHHLLEVWGRLVAELLDLVPDAYVIGLTATPPATLTLDQAGLVDRLFGTPLYTATVPAVVRDGYLAPFAELAWLTTPTPTEEDWLASEAERFAELRTDLTDPAFASVGFFDWLDRRLVRREREPSAGDDPAVAWSEIERHDPGLAAAAVRLHVAGLLALPGGARVREEHRHPPSAVDWIELLDDYVRGFLHGSDLAVDQRALERVRQSLPSVGYVLTARGIRGGRSPVDRVLARSEAKTFAVAEIVAWEAATLGERLRALVLCDHERATATLPARLVGVLDAEAGSAQLVLERLVADERTAPVAPMLVTGRTVAAAATTARSFAVWVAANAPGLDLDAVPDGVDGVVELTGRWTSRVWVGLVTRYFEAGHCRALVGTRGLLGEGWDARGVNVLVDLTTATTASAVVQTRGRALRTDPSWPGKVATNWTVVAVTESHPGGASDWGRFVRKHEGYLAVDSAGEVVDGVAHVDDTFSPYGPPPVASFDAVNALMLERSTHRAAVHDAWRVGTPYEDVVRSELRITTARAGPEPAVVPVTAPPTWVPASAGAVEMSLAAARRPDPRTPPRVPVPATWMAGVVASLGLLVLSLAADGAPRAVLGFVATALLAASVSARRWLAGRAAAARLAAVAAEPADLADLARAVADGLQGAGLSPVGADRIRLDVDARGVYRMSLDGVDAATSAVFATALDEVLAPLGSPRYLVPRYVLAAPTRPYRQGRAWLDGTAEPNGAVYHAVPTVLGANADRAGAFGTAWSRWVSQSDTLYAGSPEGAGVLAAMRGADPFDVTTVLRLGWH